MSFRPTPFEQQDIALRAGFNRQSKRIDRLTKGALICFALAATTDNPAFAWAGAACIGGVGLQLAFGIRNLGQQISLGERIEASAKAAYWNCQRVLTRCINGTTPK